MCSMTSRVTLTCMTWYQQADLELLVCLLIIKLQSGGFVETSALIVLLSPTRRRLALLLNNPKTSKDSTELSFHPLTFV
jgi:hypothetical protein